jgi:Protein of unknown function (DUF1559)
MRRWVTTGIVAGIAVTVVLLVLPWITRVRGQADRAGCLSRFERLGQFAALYHQPPPGALPSEVPQAVPPGTIPNADLPPDRRLSWIPDLLPFLDQKLQPTADIVAKVERSGAWDSPTNTEVAKTRLVLFTCPGAIPEVPPGSPMPTQFIGLAGVGTDAATIGLPPPVVHTGLKLMGGGAVTLRPPVFKFTGCFRYNAPTPLSLIRAHDGLSSTLLFAETANELGPWTRGGFSTVRGLDVNDGAKRPIGRGGQFGGNYDGMGGFGFADGSARFFTERTSSDVLWALMTIAGQGTDPLPGGE